jgi:fatty acid desaturase
MFPQVPWYNLPKLHELIKDQLPPRSKGLFAAYKEIIPTIHRQAFEPSYSTPRDIPS